MVSFSLQEKVEAALRRLREGRMRRSIRLRRISVAADGPSPSSGAARHLLPEGEGKQRVAAETFVQSERTTSGVPMPTKNTRASCLRGAIACGLLLTLAGAHATSNHQAVRIVG